MNNVVLRGTIRNIGSSHESNGVQYDAAQLFVSDTEHNEQSALNIKFKHNLDFPYSEGDEVSLVGNLRSYSNKEGNKNKVSIYIFTYFDEPDSDIDSDIVDRVEITGRVCKKHDAIRTDKKTDTRSYQFILANNIITSNSKINSYIPCICYDSIAEKAYNTLNISDKVKLIGRIRSREYTKTLSNGESMIGMVHELVIDDLSFVEDLQNEI